MLFLQGISNFKIHVIHVLILVLDILVCCGFWRHIFLEPRLDLEHRLNAVCRPRSLQTTLARQNAVTHHHFTGWACWISSFHWMFCRAWYYYHHSLVGFFFGKHDRTPIKFVGRKCKMSWRTIEAAWVAGISTFGKHIPKKTYTAPAASKWCFTLATCQPKVSLFFTNRGVPHLHNYINVCVHECTWNDWDSPWTGGASTELHPVASPSRSQSTAGRPAIETCETLAQWLAAAEASVSLLRSRCWVMWSKYAQLSLSTPQNKFGSRAVKNRCAKNSFSAFCSG